MSNSWCYAFVKKSLALWPEDAAVLEVGSRNVNGSPRDVLYAEHFHTSRYIGVDLEAGPGVDMVEDAARLDNLVLNPGVFDVVISTEMLEHVADWRTVLEQMEHRIALGGLLVLTTRSPGFEYHPYPLDCWRFTVEDIQAIFADGWEILHIDTDPDPGQKGDAPYFGVGVVAARLSGVPSERWGQGLDDIQVHMACE